MKMVEKTGKTVDEAIELALGEMGISRSDAQIEVLEEPTRGFLGILGGRPARVKIMVKPNPAREATQFLEEVVQAMGMEANIQSGVEDDLLKVSMTGPEMGLLIGRRGETLDSLQYLLNLAVNKKAIKRIRVVLDIDGYRERRAQSLYHLAQRISEKVKRTGDRIILEPMSPQERRLIHTALQDDRNVVTFSEGEEPHRKVVVAPKK